MPEYSLDDVTINGFRGLKNLRLDGLGLINILVGPNNCGKTSVLEALSILCNASDPFEWLWMVRRRDFGGLDESRIQSLRWCFPQHGQLADPEVTFEGECSMSCSGSFPLRRLRVTYRDIEGEPDPKKLGRRGKGQLQFDETLEDVQPRRGAEITHFVESDAPLLRSASFDPQPVVIQVWEDYPIQPGRPRRRSLAPTETLTPYSYQINRVQVSSHSRFLFGHEQDMILDLVREFDSEIIDMKLASFRGRRPAIYLMHRRLGPAPLSVFGDALRRVVLLASTLLALKDGGILLIDEIETGIHVSTIHGIFTWLIRIARQFHVQVVATTHSLEAVDAFALSAQDGHPDLVTYHLDQTERETRTKRIDGDLLHRLRSERGLDVR
ncbi:MAG: AAA family ATPase [Isosphaeraceae bacterium]|jgi:energy-coupling factor transporter ATP-binding protein EcfA2